MHELSLAEDLAACCAEKARGRRVMLVRARCGAGVDTEELAIGFWLAAAGLPGEGASEALESASLELEAVPPRIECPCGFSGELDADRVVGHIGVCPRCGRAGGLAGGLELVGLRFAGEEV